MGEVHTIDPPGSAVRAAARSIGQPPRTDSQAEMTCSEDTGEAVAMTVATAELRQIVERIERLQDEKATVQTDIAEVYAEAKGRGFDRKALREIVRLRAKDPTERLEEEAILDLYKSALGMA